MVKAWVKVKNRNRSIEAIYVIFILFHCCVMQKKVYSQLMLYDGPENIYYNLKHCMLSVVYTEIIYIERYSINVYSSKTIRIGRLEILLRVLNILDWWYYCCCRKFGFSITMNRCVWKMKRIFILSVIWKEKKKRKWKMFQPYILDIFALVWSWKWAIWAFN